MQLNSRLSRTFFPLVAAMFLTHCTTTSSAPKDIEGVVVMVGSAPNARPVIEPDGPKSQIEICPGAEEGFLRRFGGTIIKGEGEASTHPITKERCFLLKSFHVTQLIKGRPAYIGNLIKDTGGNIVLETLDGKKMTIEQPSKGITDLTGKKILIDLLSSPKAAQNGASGQLWKVVSYMEFPAR